MVGDHVLQVSFQGLYVACFVFDRVIMDGGVDDCFSLPIVDEMVFDTASRFVLDVVVLHLVVYGWGDFYLGCWCLRCDVCFCEG